MSCLSHAQEVLQLNYSERFWRKYQFYFAYCEAAFDARYIHDFHVTWVKDAATAVADVAGATANGPSGLLAGEPGHIREAVVQELPSDPVNQVRRHCCSWVCTQPTYSMSFSN